VLLGASETEQLDAYRASSGGARLSHQASR
jgi:hypothetical protein